MEDSEMRDGTTPTHPDIAAVMQVRMWAGIGMGAGEGNTQDACSLKCVVETASPGNGRNYSAPAPTLKKTTIKPPVPTQSVMCMAAGSHFGARVEAASSKRAIPTSSIAPPIGCRVVLEGYGLYSL